MKSRLHWILAAITVIIAYLFQSATGKRLLFFDKVPDNIHELIFDNSLIIVGCLAFIYILVYLIIWCSSKNKQKKICDNVCEHIFKFIKEKTNDNFMQFIRVTIFKAKYIKFDWAKLVFHSRHQTRIPYKKTKLKFKPGYGCAGMCFQTQTLILQKIQEFNPNQPEIYEKELKN